MAMHGPGADAEGRPGMNRTVAQQGHGDVVHPLRARRLQLHTQDEAIVLMRTDCHVCRSEGLTARSQVLVSTDGHDVLATLYQVSGDFLAVDEVGLSEAAWRRLHAVDGDRVTVRHADPVESLGLLRHRIYGNRLDHGGLSAIMSDIVEGRYSDVHLAAFVTACATLPLDERETIELTRVMVETGEQLRWQGFPIVDKHSVGGLPGNKTTPIDGRMARAGLGSASALSPLGMPLI